MSKSSFLVILSAVLCPPFSVFLVSGPGGEFLLNVLLTLLGWLPGILHALVIYARSTRPRSKSSKSSKGSVRPVEIEKVDGRVLQESELSGDQKRMSVFRGSESAPTLDPVVVDPVPIEPVSAVNEGKEVKETIEGVKDQAEEVEVKVETVGEEGKVMDVKEDVKAETNEEVKSAEPVVEEAPPETTSKSKSPKKSYFNIFKK